MAKTNKLHPSLHKVRYERTFVMVKPDGVMRGLTGEVIHRFERAGLKIIALKMARLSRDKVLQHYPSSDEAWLLRLGEKGFSAYDGIEDVDPAEVLGSSDRIELGHRVVKTLIEYLTSGPVVYMVVEGIQAIEMVRKMAGHTHPAKAPVGTIRGDFSVDTGAIANAEDRSIHNILHASENTSEANNEIKLWFGDEPMLDYTFTDEFTMYSKYY